MSCCVKGNDFRILINIKYVSINMSSGLEKNLVVTPQWQGECSAENQGFSNCLTLVGNR